MQFSQLAGVGLVTRTKLENCMLPGHMQSKEVINTVSHIVGVGLSIVLFRIMVAATYGM